MINGLTERDLERVSAYLDNALSQQEKAVFERRLQNEPALTRALYQFEGTRALLRRTPRRKVPRSFAIRNDMISTAANATFGGWSTLNLVSAAATLLLIFVFAGDIWANGLPLATASATPAEEAPQALMAQEPTAGGASALTSTPIVTTGEDTGEIDLSAVPAQADRQVEKAPTFDLRAFLAENVRIVELVFAALAISTGLAAWWRRRNL